jgi:hypothetical protein
VKRASIDMTVFRGEDEDGEVVTVHGCYHEGDADVGMPPWWEIELIEGATVSELTNDETERAKELLAEELRACFEPPEID